MHMINGLILDRAIFHNVTKNDQETILNPSVPPEWASRTFKV